MNAVVITQHDFNDLIKRLEIIQSEISKFHKEPNDPILDNQQVCQILNLSKRSLQNYRESGIIAYSQIGAKIYYKMSDIRDLLNKNYKPAFSKVS